MPGTGGATTTRKYPQAAFPYQDLIDVNAVRDRYQFEYELLDTGVLGGARYWITEVVAAKAEVLSDLSRKAGQ